MNLRRLILSAAVVAMAGVITAPAYAYEGDWVMNEQFERTTAPSFVPGFNPNDVDSFLVQFDNRRKVLHVRLDFFEAPSRGEFHISLGAAVGSECSENMSVAITSENLYTDVPRTIESVRWVPDYLERINTSVNVAPTGFGWRYDGIDANGYRWTRIVPGRYETYTTQTSDRLLDPNRYNRIAILNVHGVNGALSNSATVNNTDLTWTFTFSHTLLNRLQSNCASIYIPGRSNPFVVGQIVGPTPDQPVAPEAESSSPTRSAVETKNASKVVKKCKKKNKRNCTPRNNSRSVSKRST